MEAEPAQPEALVPRRRQRVGRGRRREGGVEGGVEAGHGRHAGQELSGRPDPGQGPGLVQGRQRGELLDAGDDVVVDPRRGAKAGAAMHYPVSDGVDSLHGVDEVGAVGVPPFDIAVEEHVVVGPEQAELQAGRPGVDD